MSYSVFFGLAACWLLVLCVPSDAEAQAVAMQQRAIAEMKLELLDGSTATLGDYLREGPVYLNFWALWCEPCKQELRAMKTIVRELPSNSFTLLAINLDSPKSLAKVKAFVKSQDYPFPIILDPNEQIFRSFNGQLLPFAILINREGNVVSTRTSYLPGDEKDIKQEILKVIQH